MTDVRDTLVVEGLVHPFLWTYLSVDTDFTRRNVRSWPATVWPLWP